MYSTTAILFRLSVRNDNDDDDDDDDNNSINNIIPS